ncbi:MAG: hypothetical protein HYZ58_01720 [Acidobacteria bacterium]|nr:hypothetical protein [Acidobacteriota bacterium]MBI3261853.1 hypothetical protein [Acidobacteriota bacterium]
MICKRCGTEIADKALICYRCGTATAGPRVPPPARPPALRRSIGPSVLALIALVLAAAFMTRAPLAAAPRAISWIVIGLAAAAILWRVLGRRP